MGCNLLQKSIYLLNCPVFIIENCQAHDPALGKVKIHTLSDKHAHRWAHSQMSMLSNEHTLIWSHSQMSALSDENALRLVHSQISTLSD